MALQPPFLKLDLARLLAHSSYDLPYLLTVLITYLHALFLATVLRFLGSGG